MQQSVWDMMQRSIIWEIMHWLVSVGCEPKEWSPRWRKTFVVLLPITLPLWMAFYGIVIVIAVILWIVVGIIATITAIWNGE